MRRIDRERRQHREDMGDEILFEPGLVGGAEFGRIEQRDADAGQLLAQLAPAAQLLDGEKTDPLPDSRQLLRRGHAVLGGRQYAGADLSAKPGDANHEEFVEVGRRDGQEAQLFEQRMIAIGGFLQNPPIEF